MNKSINIKNWLTLSISLSVLYCTVTLADIIYVDTSATGANNGSAWADAYNYLQDALHDPTLTYGDEIHVAQGIYKPDSNSVVPNGNDDREAAFRLINGVVIKGGYAGYNAPDPDARDIETYETILSGEIGTLNDPNDNCYHVFYHPGGINLDDTAVLDGFTITGGNANDQLDPHNRGGGMLNYQSSPMIIRCTFRDNRAIYGGGMFNSNSSPLLIHDTFILNSVVLYGSGMYNLDNSNPILTHCIFKFNSAVAGGGISSAYSDPKVTNCTFIGNSVDDLGGGMCSGSSSPTVSNCIFNANTAYKGGGIYNFWSCDVNVTNCTFSGNQATYGNTMAFEKWLQEGDPSNVQIINSILWDGENEIWNDDGSTIRITYSDVQGGWSGSGSVGIIADDPCFVLNPSDGGDGWGDNLSTPGIDEGANDDYGDLHLLPYSPCIDYGDPNAIHDQNATDLENRPRFLDGNCDGQSILDMGAYEFTFADFGDIDHSCDIDLFDFTLFAQAWQTDKNKLTWNYLCDLARPVDGFIDYKDLRILCKNWLAGK